MRTIILEEHFVSPAFLKGPGRRLAEQARNAKSPMARIYEQLIDLGDKRITAMRSGCSDSGR
jgi:hypothetical protein